MRTFDEIRYYQAERLYHLTRDRTHNFDKYLLGIPPLLPGTGDPRVFNKPVLIDRRVSAASLCRRIALRRKRNWHGFVHFRRTLLTPVYWIWCEDGQQRKNVSPLECLKLLGADEFPFDEVTGTFFHVQYPGIAERRFIDLPGSRMRYNPSFVASMGPWTETGSAWIHFVDEKERHERCGSGSYCYPRTAA